MKTVPSTSMWFPFLNWLVLRMVDQPFLEPSFNVVQLPLGNRDEVITIAAAGACGSHGDMPGLGPRDSFHAAHALVAGCSAIASTDAAFDDVPGLRRLAP
ncbi:MAG: type II toxin-antitoxin system VapC family toxin [Solirubrobacterales bacterium]